VKLLVTSDLHYGASPDGDRSTRALAQRVCSEGGDVLLLAGDIAASPVALGKCLALFEEFEGTKLAVPGNHDIWVGQHSPADSWQVHEDLIPALLTEFGFHPLHAQPKVVGDVGFVGSMGWYDYSFRDDLGIDLGHYEAKVYPGMREPLWNDARHVKLSMTDAELTRLLTGRLHAQLAEVSDAKHVVALVHHVVTKRLLFHPRVLVPRVWRFLNAFLGSEQLGGALAEDRRVTQVFCGHIHRARRLRHNGGTWSTIGSDYRTKELIHATPFEIIKSEKVV
jgi:predicted phosphohydrolase